MRSRCRNQGCCSPCPPTDPIIADPRRVYRDYYHPQLVQVIQPIEIVNRHHCVPVYQHSECYTMKDEFFPSSKGAGVNPYY